MSRWAVTKITGKGSSDRLSASCNSRPPVPCICRSSTTQPTASETVAFEEFLRQSKGFDSVIRSLETTGQGAEKRGIVIHQINNWLVPLQAFTLGWCEGFVSHAGLSFFVMAGRKMQAVGVRASKISMTQASNFPLT